jgi:hypothetical protein
MWLRRNPPILKKCAQIFIKIADGLSRILMGPEDPKNRVLSIHFGDFRMTHPVLQDTVK